LGYDNQVPPDNMLPATPERHPAACWRGRDARRKGPLQGRSRTVGAVDTQWRDAEGQRSSSEGFEPSSRVQMCQNLLFRYLLFI